MTSMGEAEQIFRRLNVENRVVLLGYFKAALTAENSVKKSLGLAPQPDYGPMARKMRKKGRAGRNRRTGHKTYRN
jgi:hypothetical protein